MKLSPRWVSPRCWTPGWNFTQGQKLWVTTKINNIWCEFHVPTDWGNKLLIIICWGIILCSGIKLLNSYKNMLKFFYKKIRHRLKIYSLKLFHFNFLTFCPFFFVIGLISSFSIALLPRLLTVEIPLISIVFFLFCTYWFDLIGPTISFVFIHSSIS